MAVDPRFSKWRVWMKLGYQAQAICLIHGQEPNDLVEVALREYIERITEDWYNVETYAIVMEIRSNPDWEELAFAADDYGEWQKMMEQRGMFETRSGISLRDKRIARKRVSIEIRKRNKFDVEE